MVEEVKQAMVQQPEGPVVCVLRQYADAQPRLLDEVTAAVSPRPVLVLAKLRTPKKVTIVGRATVSDVS